MAKESSGYGLGELLRAVEVWERIARIPDNFPLRPQQAAVLLTFSERTLQEWRKNGSGPAYFQGGMRVEPNGSPPPAGTNQHIRYFKPDIAAWWQKNKATSVTHAATLKGQTFVNTIGHLAQEAAFYVDDLGQIEGMVEDDTIDRLLSDPDARIEWLPVAAAASSAWTDLAKHRQLAEKVQRVLTDTQQELKGGLEATEIASVSREGRTGPKRL